MIGTPRPSATIYSFPSGGRDGIADRKQTALGRSLTPSQPRSGVSKDGRPILSASGWYHDADFDDPPRSRKR